MVMYLAPLNLAAQQFTVGEMVKVTVDFQYTTDADTKIYLYAAPYYTNLIPPLKHLCGSFPQTSTEMDLKAADTPTDHTDSVTFTLTPAAEGGIDDGTYGLAVWIRDSGTDQNDPWDLLDHPLAETDQDGMLVVYGNPTTPSFMDTVTQMLPMFMMLLMVGMIAPMMQNFGSSTSGQEGGL